MSRHDYLSAHTRRSTDPEAMALCEEVAEDMSRPSDEGDLYGWGASMAEDAESYWRDAS